MTTPVATVQVVVAGLALLVLAPAHHLHIRPDWRLAARAADPVTAGTGRVAVPAVTPILGAAADQT